MVEGGPPAVLSQRHAIRIFEVSRAPDHGVRTSIVRDPFDTLRYTLQNMSSVAVVGTAYVGLTTAVCLAYLAPDGTGVAIKKPTPARSKVGTPTLHAPRPPALLDTPP